MATEGLQASLSSKRVVPRDRLQKGVEVAYMRGDSSNYTCKDSADFPYASRSMLFYYYKGSLNPKLYILKARKPGDPKPFEVCRALGLGELLLTFVFRPVFD